MGRTVSGWKRWAPGIGVLAPLWVFRAIEGYVRYRAGAPLGAAQFIAAFWDLSLAWGVLRLARSASPVRVLLCGLLGVDLFLRGADVVYGAATGGYFTASVFPYLKRRNLSLLSDGDLPKLCGLFVIGCGLLVLGMYADARRASHARNTGLTRRAGLRVTGVTGLSLLVPFAIGWGSTEEQALRFVPEAVFLREWMTWRGLVGVRDESALSLPNVTRNRFIELGLVPSKPLIEGYPLSRPIDTAAFPYPRKAGTTDTPNVVLTLVEQLNRDFVHALSGEFRGVMPELSALAEQVTVVSDYQSITQPTIQAVVATLCSIHLSTSAQVLQDLRGGEALERTSLRCLPEILHAHGYRTVYIQSGDTEFSGTRGFLRARGFDELYGQAELATRFPDAQAGPWGLHDEVLVAFAQEKIEALEAQRQQGGPPFFVFLQTIDTHYPGHAPETCVTPKGLYRKKADPDSRDMLRALHCSDAALGQFARFLLDPQRRDATLWALSGDHPTWAGAQIIIDLHKRRGTPYPGFAAALPLFLYDPLHDLPARVPVLAGHLDLAPTLLHILGWSGEPAAMTGYSIFGTRPHYPLLVGRMPPERAALYRPGSTESRSPAKLLSLCATQAQLIKDDPQALNACELLTFMHFEDALWKYKRIFPTTPPSAAYTSTSSRLNPEL